MTTAKSGCPACAAATRAARGGQVTALHYSVMVSHKGVETPNRNIVVFRVTLPDAPVGRVGMKGELGRSANKNWALGKTVPMLDGAFVEDVELSVAVELAALVSQSTDENVASLRENGLRPGRFARATGSPHQHPNATYLVEFYKTDRYETRVYTVSIKGETLLDVRKWKLIY